MIIDLVGHKAHSDPRYRVNALHVAPDVDVHDLDAAMVLDMALMRLPTFSDQSFFLVDAEGRKYLESQLGPLTFYRGIRVTQQS